MNKSANTNLHCLRENISRASRFSTRTTAGPFPVCERIKNFMCCWKKLTGGSRCKFFTNNREAMYRLRFSGRERWFLLKHPALFKQWPHGLLEIKLKILSYLGNLWRDDWFLLVLIYSRGWKTSKRVNCCNGDSNKITCYAFTSQLKKEKVILVLFITSAGKV